MKIIISIFFFTFFFISSSCQTKTMEETYYLHKSKNQKKTAFVLLGTGSVLVITGLIIQDKSFKANGTFLNFDGLGYQFAGLISVLSSIPFFAWSSKNKRKSIAITLINQKRLITNPSLMSFKFQPTLEVKINF